MMKICLSLTMTLLLSSPGWTQQTVTRIDGEVFAGSKGNTVPILVVNPTSVAVGRVQVSVGEASTVIRNFRIEPPFVKSLAAGETQEFTFNFDVAEEADTGSLATVLFNFSADSGKLEASSAEVLLTIVRDQSAPLTTGKPPIALSSPNDRPPPVLWLTDVSYPADAEPSSTSGYVRRIRGGDVKSFAAQVPDHIIMGLPFTVSSELQHTDLHRGFISCGLVSANEVAGADLRLRQNYGCPGNQPSRCIKFSLISLRDQFNPPCSGDAVEDVEFGGKVVRVDESITHSSSVDATFIFGGERKHKTNRMWRHYDYQLQASGSPRLSATAPGNQSVKEVYATGREFNDQGFSLPGMSNPPGIDILIGRMVFKYRPIEDPSQAIPVPSPHIHPPVADKADSAPESESDDGVSSITDTLPEGTRPSGTNSPDGVTGVDDEENSAGTDAGVRSGGTAVPARPQTILPSSPTGTANPSIRAAIEEWIAAAEPPQNATEGANFRYNQWGQIEGTAGNGGTATPNARPDEAAGISSIDYLWSIRTKRDSVDHCTLGEYVEKKLAGESIAHCVGRYKPLVPNLVGQHIKMAMYALHELKFTLSVHAGSPASSKDMENHVERQGVISNTKLARGSIVELWVHTDFHGDLVTIDDWVGQPVAKAKAALERAGLRVSIKLGSPSPIAAASETVESQNPQGGMRVKKGVEVSLVIHSKFVDQVTLADLRGMPIAKARAKLKQQGLQVTIKIGSPAQSKARSEMVEAQSPLPGLKVKRGSMVTLKMYSRFTDTARVPSVVGQTFKQASATLKQAGFRVLQGIGGSDSNAVVASQSPAANMNALPDSYVQLTLQASSASSDPVNSATEGWVDPLEAAGIRLPAGVRLLDPKPQRSSKRCSTSSINRNPIYILTTDFANCKDPWVIDGKGQYKGTWGRYCAWCPADTNWVSGIGCCQGTGASSKQPSVDTSTPSGGPPGGTLDCEVGLQGLGITTIDDQSKLHVRYSKISKPKYQNAYDYSFEANCAYQFEGNSYFVAIRWFERMPPKDGMIWFKDKKVCSPGFIRSNGPGGLNVYAGGAGDGKAANAAIFVYNNQKSFDILGESRFKKIAEKIVAKIRPQAVSCSDGSNGNPLPVQSLPEGSYVSAFNNDNGYREDNVPVAFVCESAEQCNGNYYNGRNQLYGRYDVGTRTFSGYWRGHFMPPCSKPRTFGTETIKHYGQVVMYFDQTLSSFTGTWNYCDNERPGGKWDGKKK